MTVTIDKSAGFCWGVIRTIDIAEAELEGNPPGESLYVLGDIIHNPMETERLRKRGLKTISQRPVNNENQGYIPGYTLYDAGLNYATRIYGHRTSFGLSIDNLANKRYWNSVQTGTYGIGMDRTIKFNAKIDF